MRAWWLYKKQPDPDTDVPVVVIILIYVISVGMGLLMRALTWPETEHVTAIFFVPSVILPICMVSVFIYTGLIFHNATLHYFETRKFIEKERENNLKAYARKNIAIAAWSVITPLEQPALNMLKLEGEFPLAPKTPVKIQLEGRFDQTRDEQIFYRLLAPMAEKLKGYNYRIFETLLWVRGGSESCIDELRRSLALLGIEHASECNIEHSAECPGYALIGKWMNASNDRVENRLIVIVDLHQEGANSASMENASAFLLTSHYIGEEGEKPVYLYQPMSEVTDVEEKMAVYLATGSVLTPKKLWYTGLSRTEKYPLIQALDEKGLAIERLDIDVSLGEKSAGYRWLALGLATDAVKYAQGEQLIAYSEKNKLSITALSSKKTDIPEKLIWGDWNNPLLPAGMAALFCVLSLVAYHISFTSKNETLTGWEIAAAIIIPIVLFIGTGVYVFIMKTSEAYRDVGY
ncbi:TPA: hypothetical protein QH025_002855 [Enterobacter cancerogenus]|uniref:hypothetical protein n=1 Tax=Enterobacter sp. 2VL TaxID=2502206 RepID=UPI0010F454E9|nr:hypothetical protein [Enterobacter sp. 2VL]HDS6852605.1 hypothetical protein [Enterobacter cancerogenus]